MSLGLFRLLLVDALRIAVRRRKFSFRRLRIHVRLGHGAGESELASAQMSFALTVIVLCLATTEGCLRCPCTADDDEDSELGLVNLAAGGGVARAVCSLRHRPHQQQQQQQQQAWSPAACLFEHDFAISAISTVNTSLTSTSSMCACSGRTSHDRLHNIQTHALLQTRVFPSEALSVEDRQRLSRLSATSACIRPRIQQRTSLRSSFFRRRCAQRNSAAVEWKDGRTGRLQHAGACLVGKFTLAEKVGRDREARRGEVRWGEETVGNVSVGSKNVEWQRRHILFRRQGQAAAPTYIRHRRIL